MSVARVPAALPAHLALLFGQIGSWAGWADKAAGTREDAISQAQSTWRPHNLFCKGKQAAQDTLNSTTDPSSRGNHLHCHHSIMPHRGNNYETLKRVGQWEHHYFICCRTNCCFLCHTWWIANSEVWAISHLKVFGNKNNLANKICRSAEFSRWHGETYQYLLPQPSVGQLGLIKCAGQQKGGNP